MATLTFVSLFESRQEELRASIQGCVLPKDAQKVQNVVSQYLASMFDSEGDLRMSLTQSEDYILQAAISLLNAQQQMATTLVNATVQKTAQESSPHLTGTRPLSDAHTAEKRRAVSPDAPVYALSGSAIGGVGGALLLGTWGAVFGAIAGTALALYMSANTPSAAARRPAPKEATGNLKSLPQEVETAPIDVDAYLNIVKNVCHSIDSLIETFRAQIKRVVNHYESQEKPTLEKDYNSLLEAIQSLLGYERGHEATESKYLEKLKERIEELAEMLDTYNIEVVDYDGTNDRYFDKAESKKVESPKMVLPAFVKEGRAVIKGRLFVKEL